MKLFRANVFVNDEVEVTYTYLIRADDVFAAEDIALQSADEDYPEDNRLDGEEFRVELMCYADRETPGRLDVVV